MSIPPVPLQQPAARDAGGLPCPVCRVNLAMTERHGVEIDYCPNCRGIWLDRGELDKIIERAAGPAMPPSARPAAEPPLATRGGAVYQPEPPRPRDDGHRRPYRDDDDDHRDGYRRKKRDSFLGDLFDF